MEEDFDTIWTIEEFIDGFAALAAAGQLTGKHIWDAWRRDRAMKNYSRQVESHDAPFDLQEDLGRSPQLRGRTAGMLRKWNPRYGIRLPCVITWITNYDHAENRVAFETLDMDRAAFVRELLNDAFFGPRMRYQIANNPYFLQFLPEEERWQTLEACVREFGTAIDWEWPRYTAKDWSAERTRELVRGLIMSNPDLAGSFIAGERAHVGWLAFWNLDDFLPIMREAGRRAPYELCLNRTWVATAIGDRLVNQPVDGPQKPSFMEQALSLDYEVDDPYYGWWMDADNVQSVFGPQGEAQTLKLIEEALKHLPTTPSDIDSTQLSRPSTILAKRAASVQADGKPSTAKRIAEILLDMPDTRFGREILSRLQSCQTLDYLGQAYRWLLSAKQRFSRVRFYVYGEEQLAYKELHNGEWSVRHSWFLPVMRDLMEAQGWRFETVGFHRNAKYGENDQRAYDPQVKFSNGSITRVYRIWRGHSHRWGDCYPSRPSQGDHEPMEIMIPPNFDPGEPVHKAGGGAFCIYNTRDALLPGTKWDYDYLRKCNEA